MSDRICFDCGTLFRGLSAQARCNDCRFRNGNHRVRSKAHACVSRAVYKGVLANLKVENVGCVDCGDRADRYDHRDYSKPLAVDPVCRRCDRKRGPAPLSAQKVT